MCMGCLHSRHDIVGMSLGRQPAGGVGQGRQQHESTPASQEIHLEQGPAMAGQACGNSTCYPWSRETTAEACPQLDMPQCVQETRVASARVMCWGHVWHMQGCVCNACSGCQRRARVCAGDAARVQGHV